MTDKQHTPWVISTKKECVDMMLRALPFADNEAGLYETATLISMLFAEKDLTQVLKRKKQKR